MEALELQLEEYVDAQDEQESARGFVIDSLAKAEWAMRKISWYLRKTKEVQELASKRIAQVQAWADKQEEEYDRQIAVFEAMLQPWAMRELDGAKKRSIKLPQGTLGFRKAQPRFEQDEKALLPWVKESSPEHLVIRETVNWNELKKLLTVAGELAMTPDGEVVPGVKVEQLPDTFYVKAEVE